MLTKNSIKNLLKNNGLSDEEYKCIRDDVVDSNKKSNTFVSIAAIIYLFIMMCFAIPDAVHVPWFIYLIGAVIALGCLIINKVCIVKGSKFLKYLVYILVLDLMVIGCLVGTIYDPKNYAVSYIVFMILLPIMFVDRCYRETLFVILMMVTFIIVAIFTKNSDALFVDIINIVSFGILSMLTTVFSGIIKVQGFWKGYVIKTMATHDSLTGVNNRTSFDSSLESYAMKAKASVACIYMDVNGLHVYNNTHGHAAGDQMLKEIANIISEDIDSNDIYRTGGDEFVGFLMDISYEDAVLLAMRIKSNVEKAKYSVSIGVKLMNISDLNMTALIGEAEKIMYLNKKNFYEEKGLELRNELRSS